MGIFNLALSGNSWTTNLSDSSLLLNPGESAAVMVYVDVPAGANNGDTDTVTFTAASPGDPLVSDSANLTSTAIAQQMYLYLPIIRKNC